MQGLGALRVEHTAPRSFLTIVAAHLFGAEPATDKIEAPPPVTTAPLVLAGTLAVTDSTQGWAIIGTDAHSARIHRAGSTVADGVVLKEVYRDHAVIDRGGQIETLSFPRSALLQILTSRVLAATARPAATAVPEMPSMPSDVRDRFDYENQRIGSALTEMPLMSGDGFAGLLVQAGADPSILQQMGLRPGDEVLGIDGITIIDAQHIDLLRKALASGRKFRMDVVRHNGGGQESFELDASQFQGLVAN